MYKDLPKSLQRTVEAYLNANDFIAAKEAHDSWIETHKTHGEPASRTDELGVFSTPTTLAKTRWLLRAVNALRV